MTRLILLVFALVILLVFEISFISSTPFFAHIPLLVSLGLFILHFISRNAGAVILIGYGLLLDLLGLSEIGGMTVMMIILAIVAAYVSRNWFGSKNFYSVLGYGLAVTVAYFMVNLVWFLIAGWFGSGMFGPLMFGIFIHSLSLFVLILLMYLVGARTKKSLQNFLTFK